MKRLLLTVLAWCMLLSVTVSAEEMPSVMYDVQSGESQETIDAMMTAADASALSVDAKSAILMDMASGTVLFEQNPHEPLPVASVTKVMTLLLVMEAVDDGRLSYTDKVTTSSRAASMGGSQIWLEEHEQMTVEELIKAAAVVSANDACAALAEHLCGTLEAFTANMNERAEELGAQNTRFADCSGLDDTGVSSAYDIALISRELMMNHPDITRFTTVWMDSLRNGASELVNTNRLIRFYNGATGLKTGTTGAAGYCLSATAQRDGLPLCAVVLGGTTTDARFGGARQLLDFGFANYMLYTPPAESFSCEPVKVLHGTSPTVALHAPDGKGMCVERSVGGSVTVKTVTAPDVEAPVEKGQLLGEVIVSAGETELARYPLTAAEAVDKMTVWEGFRRFLAAMTVGATGLGV